MSTTVHEGSKGRTYQGHLFGGIVWRVRPARADRDVPLICGSKQCRDLGESLFGESILELHRVSTWREADAESAGGGTGRRGGAARERAWLFETGSSTHNEFRLAARPLSGDPGVPTPLLINTREGSKSATGAGRRNFKPVQPLSTNDIGAPGITAKRNIPRAPGRRREKSENEISRVLFALAAPGAS